MSESNISVSAGFIELCHRVFKGYIYHARGVLFLSPVKAEVGAAIHFLINLAQLYLIQAVVECVGISSVIDLAVFIHQRITRVGVQLICYVYVLSVDTRYIYCITYS